MVVPGESVRTGTGGHARLLLADGSRATVESGTWVVITRSRAASTALLVRAGVVRLATGAWRAPGEALQVIAPVITSGVRGTEFTVEVGEEGEAHVSCRSGMVYVGEDTVAAGWAALAGFGSAVTVSDAPIPSRFASLSRPERRRIAVAALGELLDEARARRIERARFLASTLHDLHSALRAQEDEEALPGIAALARLGLVMRRSGEEARVILTRDREAGLREETLRGLLDSDGVPALVAFAGRAALARARRDRTQRERDLARVEEALDRAGDGLFKLAVAAAADPRGAATAGRILREGLGVPLASLVLDSGSVKLASPADLGWDRGDYRVVRTLRGREEWRTEVLASPVRDATGWAIAREPRGFDSPILLHAFQTETAVWIDRFPGVSDVSRSRPALYYQFPVRVGDRWTSWQAQGIRALAPRIERAATAAERVTTPAGTWDCVRIETRFRFGNAARAPLIHVEWVAPGIGPVREVSFRRELGSVAWDERIGD